LLTVVLLVFCGIGSAALSQTGPPQERTADMPGHALKNDSSAPPMHVTFINPGISESNNPTGTFWLSVSASMQAAAEDFGIDLEIIYSERNHLLMQRQARELAARSDPPDYVIVVNEKLAADEMVRVLDRAGIKVFVLLNTFLGDQAKEMGRPREKYRSWIGSLVPDNQVAGYTIAKRIIEKAMQAGLFAPDGRIHLVAITGDYVTPAAIARNKGLEMAVKEYAKVELEQVFVGEWSKDKAKYQMQGALKRYPEVSALWAANDPMALGAIEAIVEAGRKPGKDIMIGGLNWDTPALEKIRQGEMVTSVGGHFMAGAWAMVLLYDYHHGKDFASRGAQLQYTLFGALDQENVDQYLQQFGDGDWRKVDFTRFSRVLNPQGTDYTFGIESLYRHSEQR
jgi:ABC-type sugar transport system substrate-binding protein